MKVGIIIMKNEFSGEELVVLRLPKPCITLSIIDYNSLLLNDDTIIIKISDWDQTDMIINILDDKYYIEIINSNIKHISSYSLFDINNVKQLNNILNNILHMYDIYTYTKDSYSVYVYNRKKVYA